MIKNRTTQIMYQTIYCTLGLVGAIGNLGVFDNVNALRWDFYVHFTNISNVLCIGVMLTELIQTLKKKRDDYVSAVPVLKFVTMLGILLTFLVFNILLAGAAGRDPQANWRVGSLCFHVVLPIMYVGDWILFYERKKVKWYYPLVSISLPFLYIVFILIQAVLMKFDTSVLIPGTNTPLIYPYFFLNLETQGVAGVAKWIVVLLAAFVAGGFIFFGIDNVLKKKDH